MFEAFKQKYDSALQSCYQSCHGVVDLVPGFIEKQIQEHLKDFPDTLRQLAKERILSDALIILHKSMDDVWAESDSLELIKCRNAFKDQLKHHENESQEKSFIASLESLLALDQFTQRTVAWHTARDGVVATASEITPYLDAAEKSDLRKLYKRKTSVLFPNSKPGESEKENEFGGSAALRFGVQFEPIAVNLFEQWTNYRVHDIGLVLHAQFPILLGASADGIFQNSEHLLSCLEIKCRYNKNLKGQPTEANKHQMQAQMEVLNLKTAAFLDCYFSRICATDYSDRSACPTDGSCDEKPYHCTGLFVKHVSQDNMDDTYIYASSTVRSKSEFDDWLGEHRLVCDHAECVPLFYHVDHMYYNNYKKDEKWANLIFPALQNALLKMAFSCLDE